MNKYTGKQVCQIVGISHGSLKTLTRVPQRGLCKQKIYEPEYIASGRGLPAFYSRKDIWIIMALHICRKSVRVPGIKLVSAIERAWLLAESGKPVSILESMYLKKNPVIQLVLNSGAINKLVDQGIQSLQVGANDRR